MALAEYPDNSFSAKSSKKEVEKKVESVVQGGTKLKKRSEVRKLADTFIAEDVSNVKSYILGDVLIPAIKKAISDIVVNGIDMVLYGEAGRSRRRDGSRVSYRNFYEDATRGRSTTRASRAALDYDDVLFDSRADADMVLDQMVEIVQTYGKVSIGDLYDLAHVPTTNYSLNNYGWFELTGCRSVRTPDGYILKLPRPVALK